MALPKLGILLVMIENLLPVVIHAPQGDAAAFQAGTYGLEICITSFICHGLVKVTAFAMLLPELR
jgi:hypothetical protein